MYGTENPPSPFIQSTPQASLRKTIRAPCHHKHGQALKVTKVPWQLALLKICSDFLRPWWIKRNIAPLAAQATKYLDKVGVNREKRPRIVGTEKEAKLRKLLADGIARGEIAEELLIRPGFIKDYLADNPDQKAEWEQSLFAKRQVQYRENFLKVLSDNPGLPIKAIRRIPGNGFQWLYIHDLEWLRSVLPAIWRRSQDS